MDHQVGAVTAVCSIVAVRKAGVDGEVVAGIRVHLAGADRVETLRRLPVAFLHLRAELAGPGADLVFAQLGKTVGGVGLPDLQRTFFLEDADHDRRGLRHIRRLHIGDDPAGKLVRGLVLDVSDIDVGLVEGIQRLVGAACKQGGNGGGNSKISQTHRQEPIMNTIKRLDFLQAAQGINTVLYFTNC